MLQFSVLEAKLVCVGYQEYSLVCITEECSFFMSLHEVMPTSSYITFQDDLRGVDRAAHEADPRRL